MAEIAPTPPGRVRVKICGITREADALAAVEAGADALGFNVFRGSRRCVALSSVAAWACRLPAFVQRVVVAVDPEPELIDAIVGQRWVDALQLHGSEDPGFCARLMDRGIAVIKAMAAGPGFDPAALDVWPMRTVLLDASVPGQHGGTGQLADWTAVARCVSARPDKRIVLAGGLRPDNVAEAVGRVGPYAVDVAGGVESAPGIKDAAKMRDFVLAARAV